MGRSQRLLFTAAGGHGHLQPLLPLAAQAAADGHDVLVSGAESLSRHVTDRGLRYVATGPDVRPIHARLVIHDIEQERRTVGSYFVAKLGRARAVALLDLCRSWRPDVVVHYEVDFGSVVAAEAVGLPHAAVNVIGAGGFIVPDVIRDPLLALCIELGVDAPPDPVTMLHRYLTLTPFPVGFREPSDPIPGEVLAYGSALPEPPASRSGTAVFVTLGTIFNTESGDLLATAARGAAASPLVDRVVVATGDHVDPESWGAVPAKVTVERFVDQDRVLAECAAVVSHAGSGTVLGALRHGLPSVCLPMGADQHLNAQRLQVLELGLTLRADAVAAAEVRTAVDTVLTSQALHRNVAATREQLQAQPGVAQAVEAIVGLATTARGA